MKYKLVTHTNELLAIYDSGHRNLGTDAFGRDKIYDRISEKLGTDAWFWEEIAQAEFETYQAFGIKEIKLLKADSEKL